MCQVIILGLLNTTYLIQNTTCQNSKKHMLFAPANLKRLLPSYNCERQWKRHLTIQFSGLLYTT